MHNLAAALFSQALAELSILVSCLGGDQASVADWRVQAIFISRVKPVAIVAWDGYLGWG